MKEQFANAPSTTVNRIRAEVLRQCRDKAPKPPGLFSLTVPTGGGKTLSSLAFALEHAARHGKRRVIYAIPYTSIIEQTANIFRDIFSDAVVEHHSNLDPDRETVKSRLATENWDAPVIVTTNVQFFESLFAAKISRCRKLHNIVNSVVVLDEAQLLPPEFLQPILDVMNLLVRHYGVTFVLSTATQPALGTLQTFQRTIRGLDRVHELIDDPDALYRDLERVTVAMPRDFHQTQDWDDIAQQMQQHPSVLMVVNSRADARELHRRMPTGTLHLSALMCGEHRSWVIADIKRRLQTGEAVRVVSTQLVEAGVDVDFPVVYRALAGLDSIAQAAVLALWSLGMVLARSCALTAVSLCLAQGLDRKANTVRQQLREWCYEAKAKRGKPRQELAVETCFAPLLAWVLSLVGRATTGVGRGCDDVRATFCGAGGERRIPRLCDSGGVDGLTGDRASMRGGANGCGCCARCELPCRGATL